MEPQKPETENELKPKVRALYEAVLELLNENADISTMKVSDITSRAGIGKGTAYDYFKSKEEIIACAVMYDARRQGMETTQRKPMRIAYKSPHFSDSRLKVRFPAR